MAADATDTAMRPRNGIGTAAGVCGIVALGLSWIPFVDYTSLVLGALAIALGFAGIRRANVDPDAGRAMSMVGIACGISGFAIAAIVLLVIYTVVLSVNLATS